MWGLTQLTAGADTEKQAELVSVPQSDKLAAHRVCKSIVRIRDLSCGNSHVSGMMAVNGVGLCPIVACGIQE